jgi:hypothetical protein
MYQVSQSTISEVYIQNKHTEVIEDIAPADLVQRTKDLRNLIVEMASDSLSTALPLLCGPEMWQKETTELMSRYAGISIELHIQNMQDKTVKLTAAQSAATGGVEDMICLDESDDSEPIIKAPKKEQKILIQVSHTPEELSQVLPCYGYKIRANELCSTSRIR